MEKKKAKMAHFDQPMAVLIFLLLGVGLVCLYSASYAISYDTYSGNSTYIAQRQLQFSIVGIAAMYAVSRVNYKKLHYFAMPLLIISTALLTTRYFLTSALWKNVKGATRWMRIGPIEFQPSEITKFAIILGFASLITLWGSKRMKSFKHGFLPLIMILGVNAALLLFQPHISGTVIVVIIGVCLIFIGGAKISHLVATGLAGVSAMLVYILNSSHGSDRIDNWLDPFANILGGGYQGAQSLIAIGSGGFWGVGLGQSRQKHHFLPEPANDFIFPVVCEELGFLGATLIIIAFMALIWRGFYIAKHADDKFGTLLAVGITLQIAVQVALNLGVVTGILPVTGVSLPFFSYGGTSLLMLMGQMGILLSISRQIPVPKEG